MLGIVAAVINAAVAGVMLLVKLLTSLARLLTGLVRSIVPGK